ncbi:MAG: CBS domain-containing protein [Bacillota bacterium]
METAKEIMSSPTVSVKEEQTLKEAIKLLADYKISGLPVVDDSGKIIGIISDTDIIRYSQKINVVPTTKLSGWISPYTDVSELATFRSGIETLHQTEVREVMTKKVYTATEDTSATDIARLMNRRKVNRIPVINGKGELVGIVTRADLVQCMANM